MYKDKQNFWDTLRHGFFVESVKFEYSEEDIIKWGVFKMSKSRPCDGYGSDDDEFLIRFEEEVFCGSPYYEKKRDIKLRKEEYLEKAHVILDRFRDEIWAQRAACVRVITKPDGTEEVNIF